MREQENIGGQRRQKDYYDRRVAGDEIKVGDACVPSCSCNQVWTEEEVAFTMARSTCGSKENQ